MIPRDPRARDATARSRRPRGAVIKIFVAPIRMSERSTHSNATRDARAAHRASTTRVARASSRRRRSSRRPRARVASRRRRVVASSSSRRRRRSTDSIDLN